MPPARRKPPTGPVRRPRVAGSSKPATPTAPPVESPKSEVPKVEAKKAETKKVETAPVETAPLATEPTETAPTETAPTETAPAVSLEKSDPPVDKPAKTSRKVATPYLRPRSRTAGSPTDAAPVSRPPRASHPKAVRRVTLGFAVAALVLAIFAIVAAVQPGTADVENDAWVDNSATSEVTAATATALQTVFSYKFDTIDQDQTDARGYLEGARLDEYNSTADQTKDGVLQTKTVTTATVGDIGVSNLQGDRAEVVVSLEISANQDGVDQGTVQTPVTVTMHQVDGKWLISEIDNR